jgi:hypothetical protein
MRYYEGFPKREALFAHPEKRWSRRSFSCILLTHIITSAIISHVKENILQGRVRFPTGGIARERKQIRLDHGADSTVWMKEDMLVFSVFLMCPDRFLIRALLFLRW